MPTYLFKDRRGRMRELRRPIAERDSGPRGWRRMRVGAAAVLRRAADPGAADQAVPRALRALEAKKSAEEIARLTGHSVKTLKRVWQM